MPAELTSKKLRSSGARALLNQFDSTSSNRLYLFLSKVLSWGSPDQVDTVQTDNDLNLCRKELLALYSVKPQDVSLVLPKITWDNTGNTIYNTWNQTTLLNGTLTNYYVADDVNNPPRIYKCLYSPGTASTVRPTTQGLAPQVCSDGYVWKYMYTANAKFATVDWLPVSTVTERVSDTTSTYLTALTQMFIQDNAKPGIVNKVNVSTAIGTDYVYSYALNTATLLPSNSDYADKTITLTAAISAATGSTLNSYSVVLCDNAGLPLEARSITAWDNTTKVATLDNVPWLNRPSTTLRYKVLPRIIATGDGYFFNGVVNTDVSNKASTALILDPGVLYKTIALTLPAGTTGSTAATLTPILSGFPGDGYNAVEELMPTDIMVTGTTQVVPGMTAGGGVILNSAQVGYRIIGLASASKSLATNETYQSLSSSDRTLSTLTCLPLVTNTVTDFNALVGGVAPTKMIVDGYNEVYAITSPGTLLSSSNPTFIVQNNQKRKFVPNNAGPRYDIKSVGQPNLSGSYSGQQLVFQNTTMPTGGTYTYSATSTDSVLGICDVTDIPSATISARKSSLYQLYTRKGYESVGVTGTMTRIYIPGTYVGTEFTVGAKVYVTSTNVAVTADTDVPVVSSGKVVSWTLNSTLGAWLVVTEPTKGSFAAITAGQFVKMGPGTSGIAAVAGTWKITPGAAYRSYTPSYSGSGYDFLSLGTLSAKSGSTVYFDGYPNFKYEVQIQSNQEFNSDSSSPVRTSWFGLTRIDLFKAATTGAIADFTVGSTLTNATTGTTCKVVQCMKVVNSGGNATYSLFVNNIVGNLVLNSGTFTPSVTTYTLTNVIYPEVDSNTLDPFYIKKIAPVSRGSLTQTEYVRFVFGLDTI